jgi:hypothetical protein
LPTRQTPRLTPRQAYDSHCNLVLGDVEETIFVADEDDDDDAREPTSRSRVRCCLSEVLPLLYPFPPSFSLSLLKPTHQLTQHAPGDSVVLIAPHEGVSH